MAADVQAVLDSFISFFNQINAHKAAGNRSIVGKALKSVIILTNIGAGEPTVTIAVVL
jgi:hypothetical protein